MPESETPRDGEPGAPAEPGASHTTPGGYEYSVVGDDDGSADAPRGTREPRNWRPLGLVALAVVPAVIVGLLVWFFAPHSGGGGDARRNADVASVLNAFSSQQGTTSTRFEGELPPGFPDGLPQYPGARLASSLQQVSGNDAAYLVVYDTTSNRDTVAKYFEQKLAEDPWQLEGGQTDENGTVHQFSNISDNNVSGLVLVAESKGDDVTTIVESVQVVSGAGAAKKQAFNAGDNKPLPPGFPDSLGQYPGSTTIESAYRKQASGNSFIVSMVTKDQASQVIDYYRKQFSDKGWTVQDTDASGTPSTTPSPDSTALSFNDSGSTISGSVQTSTFSQDNSYTQVDLQVDLTPAGATTPSSPAPPAASPAPGG